MSAPGPASSSAEAALDLLAGLIADRLAERHPAAPASPAGWLDADGAAEHLRCGRRRVYDLCQRNRIPHYREGARLLFRAEELDDWVRSGTAADPDRHTQERAGR